MGKYLRCTDTSSWVKSARIKDQNDQNVKSEQVGIRTGNCWDLGRNIHFEFSSIKALIEQRNAKIQIADKNKIL